MGSGGVHDFHYLNAKRIIYTSDCHAINKAMLQQSRIVTNKVTFLS